MRRLLLSCALVLSLSTALGACASDDKPSPSDPRTFDSRMFNHDALARWSLEDRAWIMGHAVGVYLYGKTLPRYVYEKTGYLYRPGVSAPAARVPYSWHVVMAAISGGADGNGTGVMYDDVPQPPDGECPDEDDVGDPDCSEPPPPPPVPPQEPPPPPPGGDGDCDEDDVGDPDCDDDIDPDCETFLDPAGLEARYLAVDVDPRKVLGRDFEGEDQDYYVQRFQAGLRAALNLQDLGENVDSSEIEHIKEHVQYYGICDHSPLVLDLDGDGVEASAAGAGVRFDLLGTGRTVRTAWPSGDDALLALDRDGDGRIGSGAELFGNSAAHANGFAALAALDENADGVIDARDAVFARLVAWRDANRDGVSQPEELSPLAAVGVTSLGLAWAPSDLRDRFGNALRQVGAFGRAGGGTGLLVDVWFRYSP